MCGRCLWRVWLWYQVLDAFVLHLAQLAHATPLRRRGSRASTTAHGTDHGDALSGFSTTAAAVVHLAVASLTSVAPAVRATVVRVALQAFNHLGVSPCDGPRPALLRMAAEGRATLVAQFGGQGASWFNELRTVYTTYRAAREFVDAVAPALVAEASSPAAQELDLHPFGMDVLAWLTNGQRSATAQPGVGADGTQTLPPEWYLQSAPVSYPLIGLTSLAHYVVALDTLGVSQHDMVCGGDTPTAGAEESKASKPILSAVTGHSQGLVVAVAVAASASHDALVAHSQAVVRYLLWQGCRMQAVTNALPGALNNEDGGSPARDAAAGSTRVNASATGSAATPMLAVMGVPATTVAKFVRRGNRELRLPRHNRMEVALVNGPRACVVAGHPDALAALSQVRAVLHCVAASNQGRRVAKPLVCV